jgi:hypothetical protein
MTRRHRFALSATIAFILVASFIALAESHVRIVRLSSVEGQVQMDRATGQGLERAILNTPIVEGVRLVTGSDGLAEVEFENQSALRLAENSEVKFSQLLMNDAGTKVSQIEVVKGIVYVDAAKGDDIFRVNAGQTSLLVRRDTLMRLNTTSGQIQVAVFKGDVQLENQAQPVIVQKKETLTIDPKNAAGYTIAKETEPLPLDAWNKEREAYSNTYAQNAGYGGPSRAYGLQDLNYYGDYFYAPGYGYAWQPYGFANSMIGWNPYSNGAWMFYPGMGYSWASSYPWGWLPYHYGSWTFINGTGWAWLPGSHYGGQWYANNFRNSPTVLKAPAGWTAATPPIIAAGNSAAPTVMVGKQGTLPAYIPGGRIPPNFGSVIPGRAVAANAAPHGFASSNTGRMTPSHNGFASPDAAGSISRQSSSTHVFAAPAAHAVSRGLMDVGPSYGSGAAAGPMGAAPASSSHGGSNVSSPSASASASRK